jgi:tetratricopeptide (TPR) repeat protein
MKKWGIGIVGSAVAVGFMAGGVVLQAQAQGSQQVAQASSSADAKAEEFMTQGAEKFRKGEYKGAIADYTEAIQLKPKDALAYYNRGLAHSGLKDDKGAVDDYTQAIKLKPNFADAYHSRGLIRSLLKDSKGAIADFDQAIQLKPNYPDAYYGRGLSRLALEDQKGAIADIQKAAALFQQQGQKAKYEEAVKFLGQISFQRSR